MTAAVGEALPLVALLALALALGGPCDKAINRWADRHGTRVTR